MHSNIFNRFKFCDSGTNNVKQEKIVKHKNRYAKIEALAVVSLNSSLFSVCLTEIWCLGLHGKYVGLQHEKYMLKTATRVKKHFVCLLNFVIVEKFGVTLGPCKLYLLKVLW